MCTTGHLRDSTSCMCADPLRNLVWSQPRCWAPSLSSKLLDSIRSLQLQNSGFAFFAAESECLRFEVLERPDSFLIGSAVKRPRAEGLAPGSVFLLCHPLAEGRGRQHSWERKEQVEPGTCFVVKTSPLAQSSDSPLRRMGPKDPVTSAVPRAALGIHLWHRPLGRCHCPTPGLPSYTQVKDSKWNVSNCERRWALH